MSVAQKQILIVEDDHALAKIERLLLEAAGYLVHTADCGKTALNHAAEQRPDLVILDLRLPDINGYEVCRELRKLYNRWDVPILMLTALDQPADELRGFAHGADAYLMKPFEHSDLLRTISLLLEGTAVT